MKKRNQAPIPDLCAAVKRVRQAFAESQEAFARRLQIAAMTLSRLERGKKAPSDPQVLGRLRSLANEKRLTEEAALFESAFEQTAQRHKSTSITFSVPELACMTAIDVVSELLILRSGDTLSTVEEARLHRSLGEFWSALTQEADAGWPGAPQRMATAMHALNSIREIRNDALRRVTQNPSAEEYLNILSRLEKILQASIDHPPSSSAEVIALVRGARQDLIRKIVAETADLRDTSTKQQAETEASGLSRADRKEEAAASSLITEGAGPQQNKASRKVQEQVAKQR